MCCQVPHKAITFLIWQTGTTGAPNPCRSIYLKQRCWGASLDRVGADTGTGPARCHRPKCTHGISWGASVWMTSTSRSWTVVPFLPTSPPPFLGFPKGSPAPSTQHVRIWTQFLPWPPPHRARTSSHVPTSVETHCPEARARSFATILDFFPVDVGFASSNPCHWIHSHLNLNYDPFSPRFLS